MTTATLRSLFGEDSGDNDSEDENDRVSVDETNRDAFIVAHSSCTRNNPDVQDVRFAHDNTTTRKRKSSVASPQTDSKDLKKFHYESWNQKIGILDNILPPDKCEELIAVHSSEPHGGYIDHFAVTRVLDLANHHVTLPLALPLLRARYKVWEAMEEFLPDLALELVPSYTALAAWHAGSFLKLHYDSNRNYLRERYYSAILYLNDPCETTSEANHPENYHKQGFSGGDLVFQIPSSCNTDASNNNKKGKTIDTSNTTTSSTTTTATTTTRLKRIRPKTGRLVCFPSGADYLHAVEEITRGTRYALTMWFTKRQESCERLEILQLAFGSAALPPDVFQQPWETPEQAQSMRQQLLQRAGIPKPVQGHHAFRQSMGQTELVCLIAHCWWKRGLPLGDLLASATTNGDKLWTLQGGQEFSNLFRQWKEDYLPKRSRGLTSAMDRWMNTEGGLISSVRDDEME